MRQLNDLDNFYFGLPLYAEVSLPEDLSIHVSLYGKRVDLGEGKPRRFLTPQEVVDGHCPRCRKASTFLIEPATISDVAWIKVKERHSYDSTSLVCVRDKYHKIIYHFKIYKH